ncbi:MULTISPECIES: hypothetical protein [Actinomadura]|uniref:Uncharacterized protein n=1 Tax=Actinomadura geliboluensis TaxID=882440 RepID=A0A5S4GZM4_9ACTN|nr:hypothetical protein [Actinomadura geliboluensis]TMR37981.1 hypothetical protein ETD96_17305 [Actinomadura geliboluensis]
MIDVSQSSALIVIVRDDAGVKGTLKKTIMLKKNKNHKPAMIWSRGSGSFPRVQTSLDLYSFSTPATTATAPITPVKAICRPAHIADLPELPQE